MYYKMGDAAQTTTQSLPICFANGAKDQEEQETPNIEARLLAKDLRHRNGGLGAMHEHKCAIGCRCE
jgi:hypothetical protein